ncbi:MAG: hypothetical protein D3915_12490 [Candidatus Electrothrix sp. AU1_5]|nr:hypothetical protein [Candidatus Electrothrix gigas]
MNTSIHGKIFFAAIALSLIVLIVAHDSFAGSLVLGTPLTPTITLENSCIAGTITGQDFDSWPTTSADLTNVSAGSIEVACSNGLTYRILLNAGLHSTSFMGMTVRNMQGTLDPTEKIPYALYYSGAAVGDNNPYETYTVTMSAAGISATGNGDTVNYQTYDLTADVYFSMSSRAIDDYNDTVAVTVQWP